MTQYTIILFLNDFGTWELMLVMFVVLILFGGKGLPSIAKTLGKGMREVKTATDEIKREIHESATKIKKEINISEIDNPLDKIKKPLDSLQNPIKEIGKSIMDTDSKTKPVKIPPKK
ncbi:MAG TPA: twin-arginine translocase TatA/TatE family subunit [Crocinitomix sp.]|nr:twin-arginine translocase TatA/TatE family subunit [Crocinitomix sp.]